ncbi:uncharacterized protein LOC131976767 [Centropristis striata]|uniref:uncharacterized protein LOC131976767 n=1 Tax=Centropristis striata TaxID=184440 RepID=UPI0027DFD61B|nr:uncharacterized protein LOC131976767 [Centropristis striata]
MWVHLTMSFLNQMKLLGLIDLILILMLASPSKGEIWKSTVFPKRINATLGSDQIINCTFYFPSEYLHDDIKVLWKKGRSYREKEFLYHWNSSLVLPEYKGKTSLIYPVGPKMTENETVAKGNCSLKITNITKKEVFHVRVFIKEEKNGKYSFIKDAVSISLSGKQPVSAPPSNLTTPQLDTTSPPILTQTSNRWIYMSIFVPVGAFLIILFVTGMVFFIKHKRSQSFTREESGYYANFSRSSSSQAQREASCKKLPEQKAIDEPIYINTEAPPVQMDQSMDHTENVYANVDYSK